jgi:hypothetical protein
MREKLLHPGTILGTLALIAALGGTSYAVSRMPRNSVGNAQLRANAVTSSKVRNGSLRAKDFHRGDLPAGPVGPVGPIGPGGPAGPPGVSGWQVVRVEDQPTPDWVDLEAKCPAGEKVLGGGAAAKGGTTWPLIRRTSPNQDGTGWIASKSASIGPSSLSVYAICANVG